MNKKLKAKQFFCILFLLSLSFTFYGQTLISENNQWNETSTEWVGGETTVTRLLRIRDSILFNGNTYHKVESCNEPQCLSWTNSGISLREDSTTKIYKIHNNVESLLYDFDLNLGDTVEIEQGCNVHVIEIDSIQLNNAENRKRIKLERVDVEFPSGFPTLEWITGIGSQFGLLDYVGPMCFTDANIQLICFSQNDELLYPSNPETCFINTSTNEIDSNKSQVKIAPNPFNNIFTINFEQEVPKYSIELYSLDGQFLFKDICNGQKNKQIDLARFSSGIFVLKLKFKNGETLYRKIIKT